ncbi:MAG: ATP synthase F1 subunit delta, partial [Candidatus Hydrothermarchaeota archaeon]
MISSRAVRRYAKALLKIGLEEGKAEQYGEELSLFNNFFQAEEKLRLVLINPAIHPKQRTSIVEEIAKRLGLSEVIINFLRILVEKNRVKALPDLLQIYRDLLDEAMGRA